MNLRFALTLLFLAGLTAVSKAQTFRGSVIAGANFNQIDGDDLQGFHHFGANAGLRVVAVLDERWRVGPEILYTQQGARRNANSINNSAFDRFELTTLEVPLMVFFKDWRITAEAGLSFQRLFDYTITDRNGEDITATSPLKENLFAFKAGVSFLATENWSFNFRWSKHISDIDVDSQVSDFLRGRTISLRAVYTFGDGETLPPKPQDSEFDQ
ncbi:outer membrane beta-barrel protein [Lewinella sp. 4G2]|uniref:outer membrane beta-barrel protein n=1 Tax=Lewinella sp. 4G2 TaxID=1803372 RepID=UPI0007B4D6E1|nr:outer membrane beta-barrel protein [Lewinella sp. 4G2]OAV45593.1 hypothetical protein A3850_014315 [Lewinella sp. 4G2]